MRALDLHVGVLGKHIVRPTGTELLLVRFRFRKLFESNVHSNVVRFIFCLTINRSILGLIWRTSEKSEPVLDLSTMLDRNCWTQILDGLTGIQSSAWNALPRRQTYIGF